MISEKKLQEQVALIESVCRETGRSYEELAELMAVSPETMRKWRKGYQHAGERTLQVLARLPDSPFSAPKIRKLASAHAAAKTISSHAKRVREGGAPAGTLMDQFAYLLKHASYGEQTMLRALVEAAHRLVYGREPKANDRRKKPVRYTPGEE